MNKWLDRFAVTGWKRILYIGIFLLLAWQVSKFWGRWQEGVTSIFYFIHAPMHEVGHTVTRMLHFPETAVILAGTVFQILTPVAIGVYFAWHGDWPALSLCTGWLGFATLEAGTYMYDANLQRLNLVVPFMDASDLEGDFTILFRQWGCLESGCRIGTVTASIGYFFVYLALAMIVAMIGFGFVGNRGKGGGSVGGRDNSDKP